MSAVEQAEFAPIFNWLPSGNRRGVLIGCIAGSAVLHALCFYLFQIIYPPTVALLPPPARINIITPESEDGRVLLRWVEAEDPALSSTTQRPPASVIQPPQASYVPSFANHIPALREPPPYEPDLRIRSAHPPGPVPRQRTAVVRPKVSVATTIRFADQDSLGAPTVPALQFTASHSDPPQAARFRIAIGEDGTVRHCFLEASSDDPALDEQARNYLMLCRFPQSDGTRWTTATIDWGNDFAGPKPTANSTAP
ncbi:MAG: energy transducer TonB [Chthoniobacterales bacterium]